MGHVIKAAERRESSPVTVGPLHLDDVAAEAKRTVLAARRQAERILARAREQADAVEQDAARSGYARGLEHGRQAGREAGRREAAEAARRSLREQADALADLVRKISTALASAWRPPAARDALALAVELAEKIVGRVSVSDVAAAEANLAKALELSCRARRLTVRVNPAQLSALREACGELAGRLGADGPVTLVADERIAPGGVEVTTPSGRVDATIRTQMDNVVQAVLGGEGGGAAAAPAAGGSRELA
jgi:flagellar biosynthesis/type III secretory pathway protein FliH